MERIDARPAATETSRQPSSASVPGRSDEQRDHAECGEVELEGREHLPHLLAALPRRADQAAAPQLALVDLRAHAVHAGLAWQSPFFLPQGALEAVSNRMLGAPLARSMGIPNRPVWQAVVAAVAWLHRATAVRYRIAGWRAMELRAGSRYFTSLVNKGLAGKAADYALKTSH